MIAIVEPDGLVDPILVVAHVGGPELNVVAIADDVSVTGAGLELLALADTLSDRIDHCSGRCAPNRIATMLGKTLAYAPLISGSPR